MALYLYRIAQEALRNASKHSQAHSVQVDVTGSADDLHLRIEDDGVGFEPASTKAKMALGIVSMKERAHLMGGTLGISSVPGRGTRIDVSVPLLAGKMSSERNPEEHEGKAATNRAIG